MNMLPDSKITVVMYHYVRDLANSAYPLIKGLDIRKFRGQVAYLARHYHIVSMEAVLEAVALGRPLPKRAALLTFDDGYADHHTYVLPVLQELGVTGSFFVPAKAVLEHQVLDVNKIHFILAAQPRLEPLLADIRLFLHENKAAYQLADYETYYKELAKPNRFDDAAVIFIKRLLQAALPETVRMQLVDLLFTRYVGADEALFAKSLYMNTGQLQDLKAAGMHIGCHGYDHYWWNRLEPAQLSVEIDRSLSFLEQYGSGTQNWTAAYPYGSHSPQVEALLGAKGCRLAFTTQVGVARLQAGTLLTLPRLDTNDLPMVADAPVNQWYALS